MHYTKEQLLDAGPKELGGIHRRLQENLEKPPEEIIASLTPEKVSLWHNITGGSGETSGELLDGLKKHIIYGKPLDRENIIEELGDIEFYLQGIRRVLNITREETLIHNVLKLQDRYKEGKYSNTAAIERADKT